MSEETPGKAVRPNKLKGNRSTIAKKKAMLDALEASLCVVQTAAMATGINRRTHYDWMATDPAYNEAVTEMENLALDFVESKLLQQIKSNNTAATIFYLKTKGKKRGYIERQELTGADGEPVAKEKTIMILPGGVEIEI